MDVEAVPSDYVPMPIRCHLEFSAWLMPNGATYVQLVDQSEETWETYCRILAAQNGDVPLREIVGTGAIIP